jgi:acetoin utilization deacetylase AcuC-like enzyme
MRVGLVYDPVYLEHDTGRHVENADRLVSITRLLEEKDLMDTLTMISPLEVLPDELALVHATEYINRIKNFAESGGGYLDYDTVVSPGTYKAAILAAGGLIEATEAVIKGTVNHAFALVRPPGHHATCWQGKGFCIFNNIAVAAKHVLSNYDLDRILIVDFDVHHGNGTQDTFYADSNVLYFSTHEYPLYPGTGNINETGIREGAGYNVNIPMIAGWGDDEYQAVYEDILAPIAINYKPQLIMVSAGYDGHWADNLALMQLSVSGFARIVEIIKVLADKLCDGKLVFTLEGGYNLEAISYSVLATINILQGNKDIEDPLGKRDSAVKYDDFSKFLNMVKGKYSI